MVELGGARVKAAAADALREAVALRAARWSTAHRRADASVYLRQPTGASLPAASTASHVPVEHEKLMLAFHAGPGVDSLAASCSTGKHY